MAGTLGSPPIFPFRKRSPWVMIDEFYRPAKVIESVGLGSTIGGVSFLISAQVAFAFSIQPGYQYTTQDSFEAWPLKRILRCISLPHASLTSCRSLSYSECFALHLCMVAGMYKEAAKRGPRSSDRVSTLVYPLRSHILTRSSSCASHSPRLSLSLLSSFPASPALSPPASRTLPSKGGTITALTLPGSLPGPGQGRRSTVQKMSQNTVLALMMYVYLRSFSSLPVLIRFEQPVCGFKCPSQWPYNKCQWEPVFGRQV